MSRRTPFARTRIGLLVASLAAASACRDSATAPPAPVVPLQPADDRVLFVDVSSGRTRLVSAEPDGSGRVVVATSDWDISQPDWSPDHQYVAFTEYDRVTDDSRITVARADGTDRHAFPGLPLHPSAPAWSPDGTRIAFSALAPGTVPGEGNFDVYVVSAEGTKVRRLTHARTWEGVPEWSPDGTRIVYMSDPLEGDERMALYTMYSDGTHARRLGSARGYEPAWSPDGQRIAFTTERNATSAAIGIVNADGKGGVRLLPAPPGEPDASMRGAAWSPDGRQLAFDSDEIVAQGDSVTVTTRLYRTNPDAASYAAVAIAPGYSASWR